MYKKINITYEREQLLDIANNLNYSHAYEHLNRKIPQEISPNFGLTHPLVKEITRQLPKVKFYNSSFIKTKPQTVIKPHTDSSGLASIVRTVNFLFPLYNYSSPLTIENNHNLYTVDIDGPIAFRCDLPHSYENNTKEYRIAFILQCKAPWTFDRLAVTKAI